MVEVVSLNACLLFCCFVIVYHISQLLHIFCKAAVFL